MIQVPFSQSLATELAAREERDHAAIAARRAATHPIVRKARPIVVNRDVSVLTPCDAEDGRIWVKVTQRRDFTL